MTVDFPSNFADVSEIRQVPDHQEVWLDTNGFTSIIVEILERVDKPSDIEALEYHLRDIVEEDVTDTKIWTSSQAHFSKLPNMPSYTLVATSPPGAKQRGRAREPDFVGILLTMVRLVQEKTDIIIAVNVPHIPGNYEQGGVDLATGKHGQLLDQALAYREKILETFEIKDWTLFVSEQ